MFSLNRVSGTCLLSTPELRSQSMYGSAKEDKSFCWSLLEKGKLAVGVSFSPSVVRRSGLNEIMERSSDAKQAWSVGRGDWAEIRASADQTLLTRGKLGGHSGIYLVSRLRSPLPCQSPLELRLLHCLLVVFPAFPLAGVFVRWGERNGRKLGEEGRELQCVLFNDATVVTGRWFR